MPGWIALGAAAGQIGGSLIADRGQAGANRMNLKIAREQMKFQERMSSTAYARAAQDLEAAGLNRMLAIGGPSSTPSGALATMQNPRANIGRGLSQAVSTALEAATKRKTLKILDKQFDKTHYEAQVAKNQAAHVDALVTGKNIENNIGQQRLNVYAKYPWLMETDMLLGGNAANSAVNVIKSLNQLRGLTRFGRRTAPKTKEITKFGPSGEYRGGSITTY